MNEHRFLADVMLGSLARWLRILGYDTSYDNSIDDESLIRRTLLERRTALTRDAALARRRHLRNCLFIRSNDLGGQIREVLRYMGDSVELDQVFRRCLQCNQLLQPVLKESVQGRVPAYVYRTQERFRQCPACGRLYWAGTHRRKVIERLQDLVGFRDLDQLQPD